MKRFLLFSFDQHYPNGGWSDFVGSFDSQVEALQKAATDKSDWKQIVDSETSEIVWENERIGDETEDIRRQRQAELNAAQAGRAMLEAAHGQVWSTDELSAEFEVIGFMALKGELSELGYDEHNFRIIPYVVVKRKSDGKKGSLEFQHYPRFYFNFKEDK